MTSTSKFTKSESSFFVPHYQGLGVREQGLGEIEGAALSPLTAHRLPALKHQLRHWMQQCRQSTLALFERVDYVTFRNQAHPDFSPIGWHLGHIAYTEALWILEHAAGLSPQFPYYRRLFAANSLPKAERVNLPTLADIQAYLNAVRTQVFDYLEIAPWISKNVSGAGFCSTKVSIVKRSRSYWSCRRRWEDGEMGERGGMKKSREQGKPQSSIFNLQPSIFNLPLFPKWFKFPLAALRWETNRWMPLTMKNRHIRCIWTRTGSIARP